MFQYRKRYLFIAGLLALYVGLEWMAGARYSGFRQQGDWKYYRWDRKTLWALRPHIDTTVNGRAVHTNSAGFRGTDEYAADFKTGLRVLVLGDSRAYGMAVEDAFAFPYVVQIQLRRRGIDAEAINAGTPGYTAVQCRARLESLLNYQPDVAVWAAGYNDRRYTILMPPDSSESFARIAAFRKIAGVLQSSNLLYALSYEWGRSKREQWHQNPLPLDRVGVRVPEPVFREELVRFVMLCRENRIQPVLMLIDQNPCVFEIPERAARLMEEEEYRLAADLLEERLPKLQAAAQAFGHYLLGMCYDSLENRNAARNCFLQHQPIGSLHGESVLRSQENYFQIVRELASRESIPVVSAREAIGRINERLNDSDLQIYLDRFEREPADLLDGSAYQPRQEGKIVDIENFFRGRFVDECHYDRAGHILLGMELADGIVKWLKGHLTNSPKK